VNWVNTNFSLGNTLVQINPALNSNYIYRNAYSFSTTGNLVTPIFAPVPANHRFVFNYKSHDYSSPYGATAASSGNMIIAVSTNNGTSFPKEMKITSWILFFISIIFSVLFA
jgi:hypothetical protein